tara:strand:+ start:2310 stop:2777 length:468 start_codon:yes stop_codon:yes gene_type:complete
MEQKEVLNDITFVTDHLHSSDLNADVSQVKNANLDADVSIDGKVINAYDAKTNRGAQARACFENIGYEFAQLFQKIAELETKVSDLTGDINSHTTGHEDYVDEAVKELETKVSDLADNIDSFATEDYVDEALNQNLNNKIQDKLSEATFSVQVEF